MKSRTLDFLAMGSVLLFVRSAFGLLEYFVQSKDPSFEHIVAWKLPWHLTLLVLSLAVGVPSWIEVISKWRRKRRK